MNATAYFIMCKNKPCKDRMSGDIERALWGKRTLCSPNGPTWPLRRGMHDTRSALWPPPVRISQSHACTNLGVQHHGGGNGSFAVWPGHIASSLWASVSPSVQRKIGALNLRGFREVPTSSTIQLELQWVAFLSPTKGLLSRNCAFFFP